MAGTGRTQYYNLPIYQAQDKVSDLGTYNQAMTIIDQNMHDNAVEIQTVQNVGDTNSASITKIQADITQLQSGVQQAQGTAQGALNQIQEIVTPRKLKIPNIALGTGSFLIDVNDSCFIVREFVIDGTTLTGLMPYSNAGVTLYAIGKVDNSNLFNFNTPGNTSVGRLLYQNRTSNVITGSTIYFYVSWDGVNSYLGVDTANLNPSGNNNYICHERFMVLRNMQPSQ